MYKRNDAFRWVHRENGAYIFSPIDGSVKVLNTTGSIITQLCEEMTPQQIANRLQSDFDVEESSEEITKDVEEYLSLLVREGYLCQR